jgi:sucrose-6-phosphate hydrolase SacC (GH32 family)
MIGQKKHLGVVLSPSTNDFDDKASTWGCIFKDPEESNYYLYYVGSSDVESDRARMSIGVAKSLDGSRFVKYSGNPLVSIGKQSITPAVFKAANKYWMVFAYMNDKKSGRRLGIAVADDPLGPWMFIKELIKPQYDWEANDIDIGPSVASLSEQEHLIYYSNVSNRRFLGSVFKPRYWHRRLGILKIRISGQDSINVERYFQNPLSHLNGDKGTWNESLFCPGYFRTASHHYLLPATSTYSVGFPYRQYIGLLEDSSAFFDNPSAKRVLIDGPEEKCRIMPDIRSEIALDTPSPLISNRTKELWLYYAVMDRADRIWKTALSVFTLL